MEIYVTWAHIMVALCFYLLFKYASSCYFKVYNACESPFNPFVPYESPEVYRQWERGYKYGKKKMQLRHKQQLTQMFTEQLKDINDQVQDVVDKAGQDHGFNAN
ncbi:hypothetical protein ABDD95_19390 [Mucilaginibacter sp. PAMB04274]|uniref:hypothetical protein n=1 Tax=Mucilaginibacter sp. PAMB04274 TaxID=3138568 RepID=UPI0031F6ACFC